MLRKILLVVACVAFTASSSPQAQEGRKLDPLHISYASVTGSRAPLWIAKEEGLFEKYGLDGRLVVIPAGNTALSALVTGDVQIIAAPGSTTMVSAVRGLPVVIVGTFGSADWKLVAHPSITSAKDLKGKTIGISRPGTTIDFSARRALLKLGLVPGKDVNVLSTGLGESIKRIMLMIQGRFDATLASPDNIDEVESRGMKVSVLADLPKLGIYTSVSDLSATRDFVKNQRPRLKAFFKAFCEAIWLSRANKEAAYRSFRKYMREDDPKRLEILYKNYIVDAIPAKPYPIEEVIQSDIENLTASVPEFKGKRPSDFADASVLKEIEGEGFFKRFYK